MEKLNVLIPSAGKRYLHIKYFKDAEGVDKVITTELSPHAPGLFAADRGYQVPRITSPDYLDVIARICEKESINLIVPLMDIDIVLFSRNRKRFESQGIRFLLSPEDTIEMAMDKLATYEFCARSGLPAPLTISATSWDPAQPIINLPVIVKPRYPAMRTSAAYVIQVAHKGEELAKIMDSIRGSEENYVLQEYLEGTELTIDFFCDRNGSLVSAVPGERTSALSKAFSKDGGAINQGKIFHDPAIEAMVKCATENARFYGPSNFQGYINADGVIKFTEINPRFTGATVMTRASGRDFFQWSVDLVLGKDVPIPQEDYKDVYMSSWLSPVFYEEPPVLSI